MRANPNFQKLPAGYLFPEIGRRVRAFAAAHPEAKVIRLGIGDVTLPLPPAVVQALEASALVGVSFVLSAGLGTAVGAIVQNRGGLAGAVADLLLAQLSHQPETLKKPRKAGAKRGRKG